MKASGLRRVGPPYIPVFHQDRNNGKSIGQCRLPCRGWVMSQPRYKSASTPPHAHPSRTCENTLEALRHNPDARSFVSSPPAVSSSFPASVSRPPASYLSPTPPNVRDSTLPAASSLHRQLPLSLARLACHYRPHPPASSI